MYISTNQSERDKWLTETLLKIPAGSRILDAGAGELRNKPLCSHLNYVSQDFCQFQGNDQNAPGLGSKGDWDTSKIDIESDITNIPEPEESFDTVLCSEVLEHISNPVAALHELTRLLKHGGKLIITAPFCSITHQAPFFFYTGYSRFFYEYWCKQLNYEIVDLKQNGNYFDYLAQEVNRLSSVNMQYAKIKMSLWQRKSIQVILTFLDTCSKKQSKSEELLCFGYHLLAEKN